MTSESNGRDGIRSLIAGKPWVSREFPFQGTQVDLHGDPRKG